MAKPDHAAKLAEALERICYLARCPADIRMTVEECLERSPCGCSIGIYNAALAAYRADQTEQERRK